jgi:hypothetical protein
MKVALKGVDDVLLETFDLQSRFVREIAIVKQVDHALIAHVFEVLWTGDQTFIS